MKTIVALSLLVAIAAAAGDDTSYLTWMADSYMSRGVEPSDSYSRATLYLGFEKAYDLAQNEKYLNWYRGQYDDVVLFEDRGNNTMYWYDLTREEKYKIPMDTVREQMNRYPRTPSCGFWHQEPDYPNQMWLDGIFIADSFYYDLIEEYTRNETTALLAYRYDKSKVAVWADPDTGSTPLVWSRSVRWYFLSLLEDPESGGGWLIMLEEYARAEGNYIESSGMAMLTYRSFKGIRDGYLSEGEYLDMAKKAYEGMTSQFLKPEDDGTLTWLGTVEVGSLSSNGSYEYYIGVPIVPNDVKGAGPFMLAAYEWEAWAKDA